MHTEAKIFSGVTTQLCAGGLMNPEYCSMNEASIAVALTYTGYLGI